MGERPCGGEANQVATSKFAKVLNLLLGFIWGEPIFFVSIIGPWVLVTALEIARGRFDAASAGSEFLAALNQKETGAIVDYVIQFYSALLGWTMLVFKSFHLVVIPRIRDKTPGAHHNSTHAALFLFAFTLLVFGGLWIFFCGGGAEREMLEAYAREAKPIGNAHWPVATRLLLMRILVGAQALWMLLLLRR